MRDLVFAAITTALSFLIYVYPLNIIAHLLFDAQIVEPLCNCSNDNYRSCCFCIFQNTTDVAPFKRGHLLRNGHRLYRILGVEYWTAFINVLPAFTVEIGFICLVISVIACFKAILNGKSIELKKFTSRLQKLNGTTISFLSAISIWVPTQSGIWKNL